jgi:hypothetical protein
MAQWRNDAMMQWRNDAMTQWRNDAVTQWCNDAMMQWCNDAMTQWCNYAMTQLRKRPNEFHLIWNRMWGSDRSADDPAGLVCPRSELAASARSTCQPARWQGVGVLIKIFFVIFATFRRKNRLSSEKLAVIWVKMLFFRQIYQRKYYKNRNAEFLLKIAQNVSQPIFLVRLIRNWKNWREIDIKSSLCSTYIDFSVSNSIYATKNNMMVARKVF